MLLLLCDDYLNALIEVSLQRVVVFYMVGLHPCLDALILVPVFSIYLVSTDVEVCIGEESRHFGEDRVQELVGCLLRGVEWGTIFVEVASDECDRASGGCQLRIGREPAHGVPWNIKLRNYADATFAGVEDEITHLSLRVEESSRSELSKLGASPTLHAKTLVIGEMKMEDVQLDGCHSIDVSFEDLNRHKVP